MRWVFIVARASMIVKVKVFYKYFDAEDYANEYLKLNFGISKDYPEYRKGEYYQSADSGVSVGLYKESI